MFGYVTINKPELKMKDFDLYQSYYCGLCQSLKKGYGRLGQFTLTYDLTFLVILLSGLYEPPIEQKQFRCLLHPAHKKMANQNAYSRYAADMNILLSFQKMMDDVKDEHKFSKRFMAAALKGKYNRAKRKYPEKAEHMEGLLSGLYESEREGETNIDVPSGLFGELTAVMFRYQEDEWAEDLSRMGFFLGKFIYIMDAYEDLEKDKKSGSYNPLIAMSGQMNFEENIRQILILLMAECARAFERLPIVQHVDILRNVIYSGIWCRYNYTRMKRQENGTMCADAHGAGDRKETESDVGPV